MGQSSLPPWTSEQEVAVLRSIITTLDIRVAQPSMSGDDQASVRHYMGRFTPEQWAAIFRAKMEETYHEPTTVTQETTS